MYAIFRWSCPYEKNKKGKICTASYRGDQLAERTAPATTLLNHLKRNHPEWEEDLQKKKANSVKKRQKTLGTLDGERRKYRKQSEAKNNIAFVVKDFIESNTSFQKVEGPTKRELLERADLPTPSRRTLAREMKKSASSERAKLFSQVREADCLVVCIDLWISNSREDYLSVLAFFIDSGKCIFLFDNYFLILLHHIAFCSCSVAVPVCPHRF
jgi:hypothetical protein